MIINKVLVCIMIEIAVSVMDVRAMAPRGITTPTTNEKF